MAAGAGRKLQPQPGKQSRPEKVRCKKEKAGSAAARLHQPGTEPFPGAGEAGDPLCRKTAQTRAGRMGPGNQPFRRCVAEGLHPEPAAFKMQGIRSGSAGSAGEGHRQGMQLLRRDGQVPGGAVCLWSLRAEHGRKKEYCPKRAQARR